MNWKWLHGQTKTKEPYPYPCEAATPGRCVTHPRRHDARRSRVLTGATSPPATVVVAKPRRPTTSTPAISAGCRPLPRRRRRVATLGAPDPPPPPRSGASSASRWSHTPPLPAGAGRARRGAERTRDGRGVLLFLLAEHPCGSILADSYCWRENYVVPVFLLHM